VSASHAPLPHRAAIRIFQKLHYDDDALSHELRNGKTIRMKNKNLLRTGALVVGVAAWLALPAISSAAEQASGETKTITGEVVDLMCYLDHGAKGEKHKSCAEKCIKSGGPVGLLSGDQLYLVIGDHKPMNEELASKAAATVTLKGKVVERNGMKMIENAEIVK
jgi:hypothetical protein